MTETILLIDELIVAGKRLEPQGNDEFDGYNSDMQAEFLAWRLQALEALRECGSLTNQALREIEENKASPYFYKSSVTQIIGALTAAKSFLERSKNKTIAKDSGKKQKAEHYVFIGHGRSKLWARVKVFIQDEMKVKTISYESESRAGKSIIPILQDMLDKATFAILILTAEDETKDGKMRARQNVIHKAGLFQGRLGFEKAILLLQNGSENFTNVDGLQYIGFSDENIEQTFYELQRVLKRESVIPS